MNRNPGLNVNRNWVVVADIGDHYPVPQLFSGISYSAAAVTSALTTS
ncbi:hypothetical protein ABH922_001659 [Rhodococcus sp. 27YEA15]